MSARQMPDFSRIPYNSKQCREMRLNFMKEANTRKGSELQKFIETEFVAYKRQGSAYGVLAICFPVALTYLKFQAYKPHIPGVIVGLTLGYIIGGFAGMDLAHKTIFESIGVIKEDSELEQQRADIMEKCKHV